MLLSQLLEIVLVVVVGYLMIYAGLGKHALELRRTPRLCPSCGRLTRDCICRR